MALAQSNERIYGAGARVDTVHVDSAEVYRISRGGILLGFAAVRNVTGKDQPITYSMVELPKDRLVDRLRAEQKQRWQNAVKAA